MIPTNFITTTTEKIIKWANANSLWPLTFGISCCAIEMMQTAASRYDLDRFGVVFRCSPRQADLLIVSGTVTKKMAPVLLETYNQMPNPKYVIAMGSCAINGGCFHKSESVVQGCDKIIPVDVFVTGCPPHPEDLLEAIQKLREKIQRA